MIGITPTLKACTALDRANYSKRNTHEGTKLYRATVRMDHCGQLFSHGQATLKEEAITQIRGEGKILQYLLLGELEPIW